MTIDAAQLQEMKQRLQQHDFVAGESEKWDLLTSLEEAQTGWRVASAAADARAKELHQMAEIASERMKGWNEATAAAQAAEAERDGLAHSDALIHATLERFVTDCSTPTFQLARNAIEALEAAEARLRTQNSLLDVKDVQLNGANERVQIVMKAKNEWMDRAVLAEQRLAACAALRTYETQEIESMPGLNGHEDWIKAADLQSVLQRTKGQP